MKERKYIMDINSLSKAFLETLKEVSKSGNVLNSTTLSQFLARKKIIKDLLKLANKAREEDIKAKKKTELKKMLQSLDKTEEKKEKNILNKIIESELQLDNEKDFNKRFSLFLMNLCRIPGNESFYKFLDKYKQLLVDEADIKSREEVFNQIKNQMLKVDFNAQNGHDVKDEIHIEASKSKSSVLRKFFGDTSEIKMKSLKKTSIKALEELQLILGDEFRDSISSVNDRISKCDNIDYLLSLRKQIVEIIQDYVEHIRKERVQVTGFIKEIGKKLIELEGDLLVAFTNSNQLLEDDNKFSEKLGDQIRGIGKSIESGKDFEDLKKIIMTELTTLTQTLDDKRIEYAARIEESNKEKEKIQQHFEKMVNNVIEQNKILLERNQKDPLTGIFNRVMFEESITIELERYQRYMEPFSIIMFDIDYFKNINDTYGHEAGDRVLQGIAKCVCGVLRKTDIFARYGGEEFIILLPQTDLRKSLKVGKKLRETVQDTEFSYEGNKVLITVSVGITEVKPSDTEYKTIFNRVDSCMYKAKEGGRNVVISDLDMNVSIDDKGNN